MPSGLHSTLSASFPCPEANFITPKFSAATHRIVRHAKTCGAKFAQVRDCPERTEAAMATATAHGVSRLFARFAILRLDFVHGVDFGHDFYQPLLHLPSQQAA